MKFKTEDNRMTWLDAEDRNDPAAAAGAIGLTLPASFSRAARYAWEYLDGAAFAFEYKGRLVITDESLDLTEAGDGSRENPIGGPRAIFDSWAEAEAWLEEIWARLQECEPEIAEELIREAARDYAQQGLADEFGFAPSLGSIRVQEVKIDRDGEPQFVQFGVGSKVYTFDGITVEKRKFSHLQGVYL